MGWGGIGALIGGVGGALLGGPAGAIAGASILGGIGAGEDSAAATAATNSSNRDIANAQMAFQERMSSSAHQREVNDLQLAGLNPLLSANAGASTPAGASATMVSPDTKVGPEMISSGIAQAVQMKLATAKQAKEINLLDAQEKKARTEEKVIRSGVPAAETKNKFYDKIWGPAIDKLIEGMQSSGSKAPAVRGFDPGTGKFKIGPK